MRKGPTQHATVKPPKGQPIQKARVIVRDADNRYVSATTIYGIDADEVGRRIRDLFTA